MTWAPDTEAFLAGVELGVYAALLSIAFLAVIAAIRRVLSV